MGLASTLEGGGEHYGVFLLRYLPISVPFHEGYDDSPYYFRALSMLGVGFANGFDNCISADANGKHCQAYTLLIMADSLEKTEN
jgi:hypothetical protein